MNTRSSEGCQNHPGNLNRSSGSSPVAGVRSLYRSPKRGQSGKRFPLGTNPRKRIPTVGLAERDSLLRQRALAEAQQRNYMSAIALFTQLIEQNATSATDYNNRGLVYFQSGQMAEAIADYNKALQLNPRLDSVYNNRANYYAAQGQLLEAILDYDTAIELNPTNIRAWINQGITFRDMQMYDRAIECFDLALPLGRLEGHIYAERGRAYHLWGDWNCAIADYERAIGYLPQPTEPTSNPSVRLRLQVELWMDHLLNPLRLGDQE